MTPDEQIDIDLQIERDLRAARTKRAAEARATAERSAAMGGEFPSEGEVVLAEQAAPIDALPSGAAAVAAGVAALTFGWLTARRTLLAARPHLTRRWLGMFGPAVWRCGRCGTEIKIRVCRCKVCGQEQTWPKWARVPYYSVERKPSR
jgi:hypothetical protein